MERLEQLQKAKANQLKKMEQLIKSELKKHDGVTVPNDSGREFYIKIRDANARLEQINRKLPIVNDMIERQLNA